ncbi:MAG TPA: calcium-binding protein, partial [Actinomycetota bacterium]
ALQVFAPVQRTLDGIRGPLRIEGGIDPAGDRQLPDPLLYVGEIDLPEFVPDFNPNLLADEDEQVDLLNVWNNDSVSDDAGVLTDARLVGLGMGGDRTIGGRVFDGGITYVNVEMLQVQLGHGGDELLVESTHAGFTAVNAGDGDDQVHVRTLGGPTVVRGEAGDDAIRVGTAYDASLFGVEIDHASAPAGGVVDPIHALLRIEGGSGSDVVDVDDSGDTNPNVGVLTGTVLSGLDLRSGIAHRVRLAHAAGGTFTLQVGAGGPVTGPLDYHSGALEVRQALEELEIPGVDQVIVNRAGDVFVIGLTLAEGYSPADFVLLADGGGLVADDSGEPATIGVAPWAPNRVQTLTAGAPGGSYVVWLGAGLGSFGFDVGMTAAELRDALIGAIRATGLVVSAEGYDVGVKDVLVDRVGDSYFVSYQGLLGGTVGGAFGLSVAPASEVTPNGSLVDFALHAIGGTFSLRLGPAESQRTYALRFDATADAVRAALDALPGIDGVSVTRAGSVYSVAGLDAAARAGFSVDDRSLDLPVDVREDGAAIRYDETETLVIDLGTASDVMNVRGTLAVTHLYGHDGDERYYVSAIANEDLVSSRTTDFLEGDLDDVRGELDLHAGAGRHLLMLSDEHALAADTDVRITDAPTTGFPGAEIEISGLAPAKITFQAAAAGSFADGITIWTGHGDERIVVDGTHLRSGLRTTTTLNTGLGDDDVTVSLDTGEDDFFVLNTQGRRDFHLTLSDRDRVDGSASTLPLIVFGGQDEDAIVGGAGADLLFGDRGRVEYADATGTVVASLGNGGPGDFTDGVIRGPSRITRDTEWVEIGAGDRISGNGGSDVVMGGVGADLLRGDAVDVAGDFPEAFFAGAAFLGSPGDDALLGDNGLLLLEGGVLHRILTTEVAIGAGDDISGDAGADVILGGLGGDTIGAGAGADIVLGDHGFLDTVVLDGDPSDVDLVSTDAPTAGGDDTIDGGSENDFLFGGTGSDRILAGSGNDQVFGDHGELRGDVLAAFIGQAGSPFAFTSIDTQNADQGAGDVLSGEAGRDVVLGGQGGDAIFGGSEDDDLIGGHNVPDGHDAGDRIDGGSGDDVIAGDDAIVVPQGNSLSPRFRTLQGARIYGESLLAGDDGAVLVTPEDRSDPNGTPARTVRILNHSFDPAAPASDPEAGYYGADQIAGGADDDVIFGQLGDDVIQGDGAIVGEQPGPADVGAGRDMNGLLVVLPSFESASDGDDYIEGGGGNDTVFGNLGQDDIIGGSSALFGLDTREQRPDGTDFLFGGAGTRIDRNDALSAANAGDIVLLERHARDADGILGDNGNIFRLVHATTGAFLRFNYDQSSSYEDRGDLRIVVRAYDLLDYTPGGADVDAASAALDLGAADEIHGESGDDSLYGMLGRDVLYGDADDDDLIGGTGHDWASGGTGQDGILGDDGRIYTSRNSSLGEPLYGIAPPARLNQTISTPGKAQEAIIDVEGVLKKSVNLAPFGTADDPYVDPVLTEADDIVFGGLGDDFLHGGPGDDAISGAEALSYAATRAGGIAVVSSFTQPRNLGDMLSFEEFRADEFALYDEFEPRRKILLALDGTLSKDGTGIEFILNFEAFSDAADPEGSVVHDGNDVLFGDWGNDWLVGGTDADHAYGGYGAD